LPAWVLRYEYAEQFGCDVRAIGKLDGRTWFRWLAIRKAKAARFAWDKSRQKDGWANMSEHEANLIRWTQEDE
jgi:hypothetical protein